MWERLYLVGGLPRWLNIYAAVKVGGFKDPGPIYEAIRKRELEVNEAICNVDNPEGEGSWIQIDPSSYIRWLEARSRLSFDKVKRSYSKINKDIIELNFKIGLLQHEVNSLKVAIGRFRQEFFDNLISSKSTKVDEPSRAKV